MSPCSVLRHRPNFRCHIVLPAFGLSVNGVRKRVLHSSHFLASFAHYHVGEPHPYCYGCCRCPLRCLACRPGEHPCFPYLCYCSWAAEFLGVWTYPSAARNILVHVVWCTCICVTLNLKIRNSHIFPFPGLESRLDPEESLSSNLCAVWGLRLAP